MNTMKELRHKVQKLLYETIDGKEIDMMESVTPRLPHMIGVTNLGEIHTYHSEEGTLLDPSHSFWQDYEEDVNTETACRRKIESAIRLLKEDGLFSITYPYGEEAEVVYCEVTQPTTSVEREQKQLLESSCPKCGSLIQTSPSLELYTGLSNINVSVDCDECEFSAEYSTTMERM